MNSSFKPPTTEADKGVMEPLEEATTYVDRPLHPDEEKKISALRSALLAKDFAKASELLRR